MAPWTLGGAKTRVESAPFGLPVLAEVPALATVLRHLSVADGQMLAAVAALADLLATDQVESRTGVGVDHWLAAVASQTRMDRRLLVRTCRLLHRLPTLDAAVRGGRIRSRTRRRCRPRVPWWPINPNAAAGTTDVDNLGPLCPATNRTEETAGWHVTQSGAGARTWHHPRSGLTTTTVPATWRPPDDPRHDTTPRRCIDLHAAPHPPDLTTPGRPTLAPTPTTPQPRGHQAPPPRTHCPSERRYAASGGHPEPACTGSPGVSVGHRR